MNDVLLAVPDARKQRVTLWLYDQHWPFTLCSTGQQMTIALSPHDAALMQQYLDMLEARDLTDEDDPMTLLRYQGMVLSKIEERTYCFRLRDENSEDWSEHEIDIRDLPGGEEAVSGKREMLVAFFKAAIDTGKLSGPSSIVQDIGSCSWGQKRK